jgi:hypothetical protein
MSFGISQHRTEDTLDATLSSQYPSVCAFGIYVIKIKIQYALFFFQWLDSPLEA